EHYLRSWWRWSLLGASWSDSAVQAALWVLAGCALLSMLGLFTRVATVGMWALLVSFHMRNPYIVNGGDILLRSAVFLLMLMPSGAAWRLDNLLRRKVLRALGMARRVIALAFTHPALWAESWGGESSRGLIRPWSVRLAQVQLVVLYF